MVGIFNVLARKISVLRLKLVIICATGAGENLGVLAFKTSVLRQNSSLFVPLAQEQY